jgi:hypothetical protein
MAIDEFKKSRIPWDQLAFDTTKKALKKYMEQEYLSGST